MSQADKERLFYLISFIQGDIEGALQAAFKEGCEKQIRHRAALEPLAQETSLAVNQIILNAKREFGIGGLDAQTPLDDATRDVLGEEIEAIDATYSLSTIFDLLSEQLGIRFVKETRERLEARVLEELGKKERSVETLQRALGQEIESAFAHTEVAIGDLELRRLVDADLDQLRAYYLDPEFLRIKLKQAPQ